MLSVTLAVPTAKADGYVNLTSPNYTEYGTTLTAGEHVTVKWGSALSSVSLVDATVWVKESTSTGSNDVFYSNIAVNAPPTHSGITWTVPQELTGKAIAFRAETKDAYGNHLGFSHSDVFTVISQSNNQKTVSHISMTSPCHSGINSPFVVGDYVQIKWGNVSSDIRTVDLSVWAKTPYESTEQLYSNILLSASPNHGGVSWQISQDLSGKNISFRANGKDAYGNLLASDSTNVYSVVSKPVATQATGVSYQNWVSEQAMSAPTISADKGLPSTIVSGCTTGTLFRIASNPAVYYCGTDGKRYAFPDSHTYFSWYEDFSGVITVSDKSIGAIPFGGVVFMKPGTLVKIASDPKVYAVSKGGTLRWVRTESVASQLCGTNWNRKVIDISPAFFSNYVMGETLE